MAAGDRRVCPLCERRMASLRQHLLAPTVHSAAEVLALSQHIVMIDGMNIQRIAELRMQRG